MEIFDKVKYLRRRDVKVPIMRDFDNGRTHIRSAFVAPMETIDVREVVEYLIWQVELSQKRAMRLEDEFKDFILHSSEFAHWNNPEKQEYMERLKEKFEGEWPHFYPPENP